MIMFACACGAAASVAESEAGKTWSCPSCGRRHFIACGEALPQDAGAGDFDARLVVTQGSERVGEEILLGGVADIELGKLPEKHISLQGSMVSRVHCHLKRLDFGPSRWELIDDNSKCGTFVNGKRISQQQLSPGDLVQIGNFTLRYDVPAEIPVPAPTVTATLAASAPPIPTPAHSPQLARSAPAGRVGGKNLSYATAEAAVGERPLGECDINWVMSVRNGARLMAYAAMPVVPSFFICGLIMVICLPFSAISLGAASWFLGAKEPNVKENVFWTLIRLVLRATGTATAVAIPLLFAGGFLDYKPIAMAGAISMLAIPVYMFLCLLYLAKLASRLPNTAMVAACIVVMIALPASLGLVIYGTVQAAMSGNAGSEFAATSIGALVMEAGLFAYIGILFWFNRSFS